MQIALTGMLIRTGKFIVSDAPCVSTGCVSQLLLKMGSLAFTSLCKFVDL